MDERVLRLAYISILVDFIERKLPDESCRNCGGLLIDYSQCAGCKKVINMICKICHTRTEERFHSVCLLERKQFEYFPKNLVNQLNNSASA